MRRIAAAAACAVLAAGLRASSPTAWEMNTYRDFLEGRFSGLSLDRDGRMRLAPEIQTVLNTDQPIVWSLAQAPDGSVYAGTGHRGRVYRIDKSGAASVVWTAEQPEIFALALDGKGVLYAATSPGGKIYRIVNGKAEVFFAPDARYIWSLAFSRDGALYAGTGDEGKIWRIDPSGKGEVYYSTGQTHVTCLAFDSQGRLLAGSEPNGILYRVTARDKAFVLYDANLPEIRSIVAGPDGAIYAAALGGSMARKALGGVQSAPGVPSSASVTVTASTVTVEAQGGVELKPKPDAAKQAAAAAAAGAPAAVVDMAGVEKSAIYRIAGDNTVESLWSSKEENVYDMLLAGNQIVFGTDGQGRIYRLAADRKLTLVNQTNDGEATRLLATSSGVLAATGDMGKLYRLLDRAAPSGAYESPIHDANTVARWGRLSWRAEAPSGSRLAFRTRSGNSARPDPTWSDWSEPLTDSSGSPVTSPNARYVQWKAEFGGAQGGGPQLERVSLAYLPQNTPPALRSINVITQLAQASAAKQAAAQTQPAATYSVTVTESGEAANQTSSGTPTQSLTRSSAEQIQVTWQADDTDGDRLTYALYFRGEGEREWKLIKADLAENTHTIEADVFADGRYEFRVVASDAAVNPAGTARQAELVSSPTLIDNTPPQVTAGAPRRSGARVEVDFDAFDAASPLRRFEYSVDAGPWAPAEPVDGIIDSPRERFALRLENVAPGERLLVVRAVDSANNAGLAKVVLR